MDVIRLIKIVEQYNEIYNLTNALHRNKDRIAEVWKIIGKELNCSDHAARIKWRNLRSNYMREKRKLQLKMSRGKIPAVTRWPYFNLLKFVDEDDLENEMNWDTYHKSSLSNVNDSCSTFDEDIQGNISVEIIKNDNCNESCSFDEESSKDIVEEKYKIPEVLEIPEIPTVTEEIRSQKPNTTISAFNDDVRLFKRKYSKREDEYNDPDFMFLRSIIPMMKSLDVISNLEFKAEIMQLLKCKLQARSN